VMLALTTSCAVLSCRAALHVSCLLWACLRCVRTYWGSPWVRGGCIANAAGSYLHHWLFR
jgi:hypothetical protein